MTKRPTWKDLLRQEQPLLLPCAHDALSARLIERERALVNGTQSSGGELRRRPWRAIGMFVLGFAIGLAALLLAAMMFGGN